MHSLTFQDKRQQHMVQDKIMWHMVELSNMSNVVAYDGFLEELRSMLVTSKIWVTDVGDGQPFSTPLLTSSSETTAMKPVHNDQVDNKLDMNIRFAFPSLVYIQLKRTKPSNKNSNSFS